MQALDSFFDSSKGTKPAHIHSSQPSLAAKLDSQLFLSYNSLSIAVQVMDFVLMSAGAHWAMQQSVTGVEPPALTPPPRNNPLEVFLCMWVGLL